MKKSRIIIILALLLLPLSTRAQDSPWSINIYDYQYDMSAYISLKVNDVILNDYSNFVIAAFCGTECRGIAENMTAVSSGKTKHFARIRIRSNNNSVDNPDVITFKVYAKDCKKTVNVEGVSLSFLSESLYNLPSNPLEFSIHPWVMGDVNDDGEIDIADAVCIVNHVVGKPTPIFVSGAADVNRDGVIDIADAVKIVNFVVGKIGALSREAIPIEEEREPQ